MALLNFLWFGDITYNMQSGFSVLPPFAVTRCRAYHPPGVEESRTLLSDWMVGFRLFFSGVYVSDAYLVLVQHLCVQYIVAAITCVVYYMCTSPVCSTVVRHRCVQCSVAAPVCVVQWYNTGVQYSKGCLPEGTGTVRSLCRSP